MIKKITLIKDLFRVLDILEQHQITFWVEGGWGVDALIGHQTREHRDIDIDFDSKHQDKLLRLLADMGYKTVVDELPVRAELYHDDYGYLDIHPFIIETDGSVKQGGPNGTCFKFDKAWFTVSTFMGREVPCYTKAAQRLFHSGYKLREQDKLDLISLDKIN